MSRPDWRASLRGRWLRLRRWEYWPAWILYLCVLPPLLLRAWRGGGPRSVTCVNPAIELGGLVGESKAEILALIGDRDAVARWRLIDPGDPDRRRRQVEAFASTLAAPWPIVLKPDRGERGAGVSIVRTAAERDAALRSLGIALIAQEFVPGPEWGIFWVRGEAGAPGQVLSVAAKEPVRVTGDGERTVAELMAAEDRALPFLALHRRVHEGRLDDVLPPGQTLDLTELGTHCRGATFLDATGLATPSLARALDRIMEDAPGLEFGRFDVRGPSPEELREGRNLRVIEFNGLSSEPAHIYDPGHGFGSARAALVDQWTRALEIGRRRRAAGRAPASWRAIARSVWRHHRERGLRGG